MNMLLLYKMIQARFYQYHCEEDALSEEECATLAKQVWKEYQQTGDNLHELIEDAVYEFLTK
ncbi:YqzH family protein [Ectobacillus antri]|jgi:hypothetical protein|uniref:YqzH family protein n=1 Tax=Ectobacillus antri TaxID=2486280 RepID=A0ABT6H1W9_9BACI|nr:YqzH family protein [Ectobacillus antri]MDG4655648.1 YqzH family protein [Ectobacillus antri]MDG5753406.1 YqzH family protein [Ectobacillus antri]